MSQSIPDVKSIFGRALEITSPDARAKFLQEACRENPAVLAEVNELLVALGAAGSFMDQPAVPLGNTENYSPPISEKEGTQIGSYKLMEQIGEGGFGLVFVAEQQQPVRRKVALKVIKPGMDSRQVIARFEAERQALALMEHPHIAKVFDGGTTETGRPYFVMELVRGVPITEYCDANSLPPKERLELFIQVCQAVQHAHQKGVIHRDLKPSNILVAPHDGVPVVKVIDFGVAKALGQSLTDKTIYTRFAQMIGTPLYMSPEQAEVNQLDVDTRSDIYSLGVVLYELLTGSTPFDRERFCRAAYDEIRRIIKEEEPPRPSTRLTSLGDTLSVVSAKRGTDPNRLAGLVRGELDWIVMRCLEKDRNRRYDNATGLARDVQCYLAGDAVEACPPTLGYRIKKIYRRNRTLIRVASAFLSLALGTAVMAVVLATQARLAEQEARVGRAEAFESAEAAVRERNAALESRKIMRQEVYSSDLQLANSSWQTHDSDRVLSFLERQIPTENETDLRGFEWHYLNRQCRSDAKSFQVTPGRSSLNTNGSRLVKVSDNPKRAEGQFGFNLQEWDCITGRPLPEWTHQPSEKEVLGFASYSRDGKRILVSLQEPDQVLKNVRIKVLDVESHRVLFEETIFTSTGLVRTEMDSSGQHLAVMFRQDAEKSHTIAIWDVDQHKILRRVDLPLSDRVIGSVNFAISPDAKHFAARVRAEKPQSDSDNNLRIWKTETGELVANLPLGNETIDGLKFSPDGKFLVHSIQSGDGVVIREANSGKVVRELIGASGSDNILQVRRLTFSTDGTWLICHTLLQTQLLLWNLNHSSDRVPARILPLSGNPGSIAFSEDNRFITVALTSGRIQTFLVEDQSKSLLKAPADASNFAGLCTAEHASNFAAAWEVKDGQQTRVEIRVGDEKGQIQFSDRAEIRPDWATHTWSQLCLSVDGKRLAHTTVHYIPVDNWTPPVRSQSHLRVWDIPAKQIIFQKTSVDGEYSAHAFTPDGQRLIGSFRSNSPSWNTTTTQLSIWELSSDKEVFGQKIFGTTHGAVISTNGNFIAWKMTLNKPKTEFLISVWNSSNGEEMWHVSGENFYWPTLPTISPDGKILGILSSKNKGGNNEIQLYKLADGTPVGRPLPSQRGGIEGMKFSPDCNRLFAFDRFIKASGTEHRGIVWDLTTGRVILNSLLPDVRGFSFDSAGQKVQWLGHRLGTYDAEISTWDATPLAEAGK